VASGIVSAVYFVPLSAAYRRGALSSVYPVARGSGALLGVVAGVAILGERLQPLGFLGVLLLLGGTLTAALATATRSTVAPALLAGCAVAGYSALDRVGVRTGPAWLYAWALWTVCAVGLVGWRAVAARVLPRLPGSDSAAADGDGLQGASTRRSLAAGLLIIGTYMLILLAFQIAPLAGVAPLREATTILAAAWGVIALRERDRAVVRLGAAAAVAAGAILLATSG
jgi:multidrug transporter EmrE-like cation transporter